MTPTIKINGIEHTRSKILAIGKVLQQPMRDLLTREARLVAISCAKSTQPYGSGSDARDSGLKAVNRDIRRVYATTGKAFADIANVGAAKGFWKAIQKGNIAKAQAILDANGRILRGVPIQSFDGGGAHKSARNTKTGRVSQKRPGMIVLKTKALDAYVAAKQKFVGFGKSAWANIARQLGGIRGLKAEGSEITANWISRNQGKGTVDWSGDANNPIVTLTSRVRYASQILSETERRQAVAIARGRLVKNLAIAVQAEMRKLPSAA